MKNVMGILGFQLKTENIGSIEASKAIISLSNDVSFKVKAFEILLITDCLVWPPLQSNSSYSVWKYKKYTFVIRQRPLFIGDERLRRIFLL